MAVNTAQLYADFRSQMADPQLPGDGGAPDEDSLWSDSDIYFYMDEAQKEFAARTLCFPDYSSYTPAVTTDDPWVTVDERIVKVRKARLVTAKRDVLFRTLQEMQDESMDLDYGVLLSGAWEDDSGTPRFAITDLEQHKARLVPIPEADDTLNLAVYRLPLNDITGDDVALEIPDRFRRGLLHKMREMAYLKYDAEQRWEKSAQDMALRWELFIKDAEGYFKTKRRGPQVTRYGGI